MGIFDILFRNTGQKARTLRPDDVSIPEGYRGILEHNLSLCIGCKTCAYVCSPGAIRLDAQPGGVAWQYQAARCTYCSRCAEYCPTGAIRLEAEAHQSALAETGSPVMDHLVEVKHCARCGQPFNPLPVPILERLIGHEIRAVENGAFDMVSLMRLCEKCRSRVTSQRFKDSLT